MTRKVCVVTGTRAEYGLLRGLMDALRADSAFQLQVVATAMHLAPEFGLTARQIEADGFVIDERVEMLVAGDSPVAVTKSLGLGLMGLADAYRRLAPDLVVLLGDRFEALAAAQAALLAGIPIAHIHGGELTEGALDESIRHAITKMASLHFVATQEFRRRVIQLGEQPGSVIVTGAPGIDAVRALPLLQRGELEQALDFSLGERCLLVTYHPVTLDTQPPRQRLRALLKALDQFPEVRLLITYPNADSGGRELIDELQAYAHGQPGRVLLRESLGQLNYLSALQFVAAVVGNSSSGLLEVPSFRKPTVNVGDRQKGRPRAASVIDCSEETVAIVAALKQALSADFQASLAGVENPYGEGRAVDTMMAALRGADLPAWPRKPFYDLPPESRE